MNTPANDNAPNTECPKCGSKTSLTIYRQWSYDFGLQVPRSRTTSQTVPFTVILLEEGTLEPNGDVRWSEDPWIEDFGQGFMEIEDEPVREAALVLSDGSEGAEIQVSCHNCGRSLSAVAEWLWGHQDDSDDYHPEFGPSLDDDEEL